MSAAPRPAAPTDAADGGAPAAPLLRAMRRRIAAVRDAAAAGEPPPPPANGALVQAAAAADVGTTLPPLGHLGAPRRLVASLVGRLALYFLRLLSVDQSRFNHLIVRAVAELTRRDEAGGAARRELAATIEQQAAALTALRAEQAALRRALQLRLEVDTLQRSADVGRGARGPAPVTAPGPRFTPALEIGDEAARRERLRRYVPLFAGCRAVLDLGCGRGEFLELLHESGVPARGVDLDGTMARLCQEKGLAVACSDAVAALADVPEGALDGVFCAQLVEHLPTPDMLRLVELAARALRPGGVLVIETLNPESLLVLYRWFWMDLTHQRLVHPETLRDVCTASGLQRVEVRYVPPPEGAVPIPPLDLPGADPEQLARFNGATQFLNQLLYASFDYAVVGWR